MGVTIESGAVSHGQFTKVIHIIANKHTIDLSCPDCDEHREGGPRTPVESVVSRKSRTLRDALFTRLISCRVKAFVYKESVMFPVGPSASRFQSMPPFSALDKINGGSVVRPFARSS